MKYYMITLLFKSMKYHVVTLHVYHQLDIILVAVFL